MCSYGPLLSADGLRWGYTLYDHIRSINEVISVMVFRAITLCRLSEGSDRM